MNVDLAARVERVYRYCRARCFTSAEAEDMAQDILLAAWKARERLERADDPDAYLGGICRKVYAGRARRGRREAGLFVRWEALQERPEAAQSDLSDELTALQACVARLARCYRELIIAHYFQGQSVRSLAQQSGMPEGTVKWRLSLARQAIKKEWNDMEERAYMNPVHFELQLSGMSPGHYIVPELTTPTRRLLLFALQQPMTALSLAERTGVPTMLVEEELLGLEKAEAVARGQGGTYAATFFIEPLQLQASLTRLTSEHAPGMARVLQAAMAALRERILSIGFHLGRSYEEIEPTLLMHLLHDGADFEDWDPPMRPDGGKYYFIAHETKPGSFVRRRIHDWYDLIAGLEYRTCVPGDASVMSRIGQRGRDVAAACKQLHDTGSLEGRDPEFVASLIAAGVLARRDGQLSVAVPWLTKAQFTAFTSIAKELTAAAREEGMAFRRGAEAVLRGALPAHLRGDLALHCVWAHFDLMLAVADAFWPKDSFPAAGLIFVEEDAE